MPAPLGENSTTRERYVKALPMSKFATITALALAFLPVLAPGLCFGQATRPARAGAPASARGADALAVSAMILEDVSKIRRLRVLRPVPSGVKSKADIEAMVIAEMRRSSKPREYEDASTLLRFLGLVPAGFDLRRESTALLTEQVAGFYTPRSRYFYLADWIPVDQQRTIIAHELAHALADQHFDLRRLEDRAKKNSDARLATQALVEGDATAVMLLFSLFERGIATDLGALQVSLTEVLRDGGSDESDQPVFRRAPEVLRETLQFPYAYGAGFVQQLLRAGSWQRVDACYAAPPVSTEQVMHPEKYFADERPEAIAIPDLGSVLGSGWRRADDDVMGEFGCSLLLRSALGADGAFRAAAGWGGDRYHFYVNDDARACVYVHLSAWDSEADALEFEEAYTLRANARIGAPASSESGPRRWSSSSGVAGVERRGRLVLAFEADGGVPVGEIAARVWRSAF